MDEEAITVSGRSIPITFPPGYDITPSITTTTTTTTTH